MAPATSGAPRRIASALAALSAALTDERDSDVPPEPSAPEPVAPSAPAPAAAQPEPAATTAEPHATHPEPPAPSVRPEASAATTAPQAEPSAPMTATQRLAKARARLAQGTATLDVLRGRLAAALDRNTIIDALLEFGESRVLYMALFTVKGESAEGLDARGHGLDGERVRKLTVPLDAPGVFNTVRERGVPTVGDVSGTRADREIKEDLGRPAAANVAVLPVHIGGRVVLIAWADNGVAPLESSAVEDLAEASREAARALQRLIVDKKRRQVNDQARPRTARRPPPAGTLARVARASVPPPAAPHAPAAPASRDAMAPSEPRAPVRPTPAAARSHSNRPAPKTPLSPPEAEPARDTILSPPAPEFDTRFARGGRVPIAVDVVGPLPGPGIAHEDTTAMRIARARDPRREPDEVPGSNPAAESDALVAEIVRTGSMGDAVANKLLGAGDAAIVAVFRYFPGPTAFDRMDASARRPSVADAGPLLHLVTLFRMSAAPRLIELLDAPNAEQRYFATLCLGEIVHPAAIPGLLPRLFDADTPVRTIAVDVLRAYRKFHGIDQVLRQLRAMITDAAVPGERRRIAAHAVGELRDPEAVPALLFALNDRDHALVAVSHRSLVVLARQDFRDDAAAWRAWWDRVARTHRIEWLIAALVHEDATIRHEASEELKKLTGQFFGYYFNLPKREREKAHKRYVEWWEREGRIAFAP
jgi:hypothetical protein